MSLWIAERRGGGEKAVGCGDGEVEASLQQRDPQGVGLPSAEGRDLLRLLLQWDAEDRITATEALDHPYLARGPG